MHASIDRGTCLQDLTQDCSFRAQAEPTTVQVRSNSLADANHATGFSRPEILIRTVLRPDPGVPLQPDRSLRVAGAVRVRHDRRSPGLRHGLDVVLHSRTRTTEHGLGRHLPEAAAGHGRLVSTFGAYQKRGDYRRSRATVTRRQYDSHQEIESIHRRSLSRMGPCPVTNRRLPKPRGSDEVAQPLPAQPRSRRQVTDTLQCRACGCRRDRPAP